MTQRQRQPVPREPPLISSQLRFESSSERFLPYAIRPAVLRVAEREAGAGASYVLRWQFGFLQVWLFAHSVDDASRKAAAIVDALPYERKEDVGMKIALDSSLIAPAAGSDAELVLVDARATARQVGIAVRLLACPPGANESRFDAMPPRHPVVLNVAAAHRWPACAWSALFGVTRFSSLAAASSSDRPESTA